MSNITILDARYSSFRTNYAEILKAVAENKIQIQIRCDSQLLAESIRKQVFDAATKDGRQFEITILGSGAAVGIKMHIPDRYVWDESKRQSVPIEVWNEEHPENLVADTRKLLANAK